jgi:hypothetical protein
LCHHSVKYKAVAGLQNIAKNIIQCTSKEVNNIRGVVVDIG